MSDRARSARERIRPSRAPGEHALDARRGDRAAPEARTVSVVIPSYNGAEFIGAALESALRQTRPPDEIIVADDGSRDHTVDIVDGLRQRHRDRVSLRIYPARVNRGIAATYQRAIAHATGEYVAFLEQDDRWPPDHLERRLAVLDGNPEVGTVFSAYRVVAPRMAGWEMTSATSSASTTSSQHGRAAPT